MGDRVLTPVAQPAGRRLQIVAHGFAGRMRRAALIVLWPLIGCGGETLDASHGSYTEAVEAGAVAAGWVPAWLPAEARRIDEVHDIDTNARMLRAEIPADVEVTLPKECLLAEPSSLPEPRFRRAWWPAGVPARGSGDSGHTYWKCDAVFAARAVSGRYLLVWAMR